MLLLLLIDSSEAECTRVCVGGNQVKAPKCGVSTVQGAVPADVLWTPHGGGPGTAPLLFTSQ